MSANVIYEDDHIQLLHIAGEKPVALVTFGQVGLPINGKSFFGMRFCKNEGIEGYGFMAKGISTYPPASVLKAIKSGVINPGKPIVTYGGSTGGSPALIHAAELNAAGAIATAPIYSVDPALIPEDYRFRQTYVPALHQGRKVEFNGMAGNIVLLFDPSHTGDTYHATLISEEYKGDRLRQVHVHNIGHNFVPNVDDRELLLALIEYALNGGEIGEIFRLAKHTKKTKQRYACILAEKLVRRHKPRLALGVLDAALRYADGVVDINNNRVHRAMVSADAYMALAMPSAAAAQIESVIALRPRDSDLLGKLATALYADGKTDPAVKAWRAAIEYAPDDFRVQKRLRTALERAVRNSGEPKVLPDYGKLEQYAAVS